MGALIVILRVLPWLLRGLAIIAWLSGILVVTQAVPMMYSAPQWALVSLVVAWFIVLTWLPFYFMADRCIRRYIWAAFFLSGLLGWALLAATGLPPLIVQVMPPVTVAVLSLYITIRFRVVREAMEDQENFVNLGE